MCLSTGLSKLILIVFNIIFFVLGLGLLILGIILLTDSDDVIYDYLGRMPIDSTVVQEGIYRSSWLTNFAWAMLVSGIVFFIIGGAGLFGACCNMQFLLTVYGTILTMIIVLEIGVGVLAVLYSDQVEDYLQDFMVDTIEEFYEGMTYDDGTIVRSTDSTGVSDAWDFAQIEFECCGARNYSDYDGATKWPGNYTVGGVYIQALLPVSCCKFNNPDAWPDQLGQLTLVNVTECLTNPTSYSAHTTGCYDAIYDKLKEYALAVAIFCLIVGLVEILGLWAACSLYRALNKERKVGSV